MTTNLYIGPLIERGGKFSYDTFSSAEGMRHSFRYPRVEQARHDQRAMIAEIERDPRASVHVCETVAEFEQATTAARRGEKAPDDQRSQRR